MRPSVKTLKDENTDQSTYYFHHSSVWFNIKMYAHHQNVMVTENSALSISLRSIFLKV